MPRIKRYAVLEADPPWQFRDKLPGRGRGAAKHYDTLTVREICDFAIPPVRADAYLFLWRVAAFEEAGRAVAKAWGFKPVAELIWVKTKKHADVVITGGGDLQTIDPSDIRMGMGHHIRHAHEVCIVATRGKASSVVRRDKGIPSVFFAAREEHSRKPDEFYGLLRRLTRAPRASLFQRTARAGFDCYGDQLETREQ